MVIGIFWSFLHRISLLPCFNGNEARANDQPHCDTLNLDKMYNCQRSKHVKFL